jgi:hypothetical protein
MIEQKATSEAFCGSLIAEKGEVLRHEERERSAM